MGSFGIACRCCVGLTRPSRIRLAHTARSFSSTSWLCADEDKKTPFKLPPTNWAALAPKSPPKVTSNGPNTGSNFRRGGGSTDWIRGPLDGGPRSSGSAQGSGGWGVKGRGGDFSRSPRDRDSGGGGAARFQREFNLNPREDTAPLPASGFGLKRPSQPRPDEGRARLPWGDRNGRSGDGWNERGKDIAMSQAGGSKRNLGDRGGPSTLEVGGSASGVSSLDDPDLLESAMLDDELRSDNNRNYHGHRDRFGRDRGPSRSFSNAQHGGGSGGFEIVRGRKGRETSQAGQRGGKNEEQVVERKPKLKKPKVQKEAEVFIPSTVSVARLASIFGVSLFRLQTRMNRIGMNEDQLRGDFLLGAEDACNIALEFGFNPTIDDEKTFDILPEPDPPGVQQPLRPPVVTIMGHVDHGKTTLLDSLRKTAVAAGEAGGITQHIGAFSVSLSSLLPSDAPPTDATITFIDTPGHAAFTAMRARGASVTDLVVLVVAADDGVMPQTREVLELVKKEGDGVGLVVAINKIDKTGVDISRVKSALGAEGILLEEDGGEIPGVHVSGLARLGLDNLVETLSTLAELRELRARVDGKAEGVVLESNVDRGAGRVATILVTRGTLHVGSCIVAGTTWCRVRTMTDDKGTAITSAGPGAPVVVSGWRDTPVAGDQLLEAINGEADARRAIMTRLRNRENEKLLQDTEVINVKRREDRIKAADEAREEEEYVAAGVKHYQAKLEIAKRHAAEARNETFKQLRLVIKADVSGTVEAVEGALSGIGNKEAGVKIVHTGVGDVNPSDVDFAEAAKAIVIGFNVTCPKEVQQEAIRSGVDIHLESVIYRLIETVRKKTAALLPPKIESRILGEAKVLQLFPVNVKGQKKAMIVAGCRVGNGTISKGEKVRILRGTQREQVFEGSIESLRHLKKEMNEIRKGMECGIQLHDCDDIMEGDEIVSFSTYEVAREL